MSSLSHILINEDPPPPPPPPPFPPPLPSTSSTTSSNLTSTETSTSGASPLQPLPQTTTTPTHLQANPREHSALLPSPMAKENNVGKRGRTDSSSSSSSSSSSTYPKHKRLAPTFPKMQSMHHDDRFLTQQQQQQEQQQITASPTSHLEQMTPPPSQYGSPVQLRLPRPLLAATDSRQHQSPLASHQASSSYPTFPHTPQPSPRPPHQHRPSQYPNGQIQASQTNNVSLRPEHSAEYTYAASTREEPRRLEPSKLPFHGDQQASASAEYSSQKYQPDTYQTLPNVSTSYPPDQRPIVGNSAPQIRSHRKASSWAANISASLPHPNRQIPHYITGHPIPFSSTPSSPTSGSTYPALAPLPFHSQYSQQHQHGQQQQLQQQHRYHHARKASASIPVAPETNRYNALEKDMTPAQHSSGRPVQQNAKRRISPCRSSSVRIAPSQPQSHSDIYPTQPRHHHTLEPNHQHPGVVSNHQYGHPYTRHSHPKSHGPYPIASDPNASRKHYPYPSGGSDTQPNPNMRSFSPTARFEVAAPNVNSFQTARNVGKFDTSGAPSTSKYVEIIEEREGNPRMLPNASGGTNWENAANLARAPETPGHGKSPRASTATEEVKSTMSGNVGRFWLSSSPKEAISPASVRSPASPRVRPPPMHGPYPVYPQNQTSAQTTLYPKPLHPAPSQVSIYTLCRRWLRALGENEPAETSLMVPGSNGQVPSASGGANGGAGGRRSKGEPLAHFFRSGTATPSSPNPSFEFSDLSATDMALQSALRSLRSARPGPPGAPSPIDDKADEKIPTATPLTDDERKTRMKALDLILGLGELNIQEREDALEMDLDGPNDREEGEGNEKGVRMSVSNEETETKESLDVKDLLKENQKEWKKARERDISAFRTRVLGIASARLHAALEHVQQQCMLQQQRQQHPSIAGIGATAGKYVPPVHIQNPHTPLLVQQ